MLIRVFRENQTFTFLSGFLLAIGLWILVGYGNNYEPDYQTLFNSAIFYLFPNLKAFNNHKLLCSALNIFFLVINGYYLSKILFKYQLLPRRTMLPLFVFILISIPYFLSYSGLSYSLITLLLVIRVIQVLFASLESQKVSYGYFDSALLISVASIFNFYSIFLVLFLIYVLLQFKGPALREFLFILVGLIVPYLIFVAILYLFDQNIEGLLKSYKQMFSMRTVITISFFVKILFSFTGFLALISSLRMINGFIKMKIVTRKYSVVFLGFFIIALFIAVFYPIADKDIIFFMGLPLSYLFSYYFTTCKITLITQVLFLLLIGGNIAVLVVR